MTESTASTAGNTSDQTALNSTEMAGGQVSFLDILLLLSKHRRLIVLLPAIVAVLAALISLQISSVYTGTTRLLPPQQSSSGASALLSQLGGALGGAASIVGGVKNPNDIYIGMLRSRTVADRIIERFDLGKVYNKPLMSGLRGELEKNSDIISGRDGIIVINVDDHDPQRAADIANAYAEELGNLTKVLAVTEASQRRLFFERQLLQAKENMTAAEIAARQGLESGGLAKADDQGRAIVGVTARLRAQISVKEVQIGAMRTYAADQNPDLQRAQEELLVLKRELARFENISSDSNPAPPVKRSNAALENLAKLRDVKYFETLYELLARQYEIAKIDEAKESALIQILDKAIPPDSRSRPKRTVIVIFSTIAAFFIAIVLALLLEFIRSVSADPENKTKLRAMKQNWRQLFKVRDSS